LICIAVPEQDSRRIVPPWTEKHFMADASLVWFRNDLRVSDNPALSAAFARGGPVHALYIEETDSALRATGGAARWWLHHSLVSLEKDLAGIGVRLKTVRGKGVETVLAHAKDSGATALYWNRRYAPAEREIDTALKASVEKRSITAKSFAANVLVEPFDIATGAGKPYSVYTPFWRSLRQREIPGPLPRPRRRDPVEVPRDADKDYRAPDWAAKLEQYWSIGEAAAHRALDRFLDSRLAEYPEGRDFPARDVTSTLSPHLRFGEISPRQVWHAASALSHREPALAAPIEKFLSELAWRDFNYHQLYHRDDIATVPMQPKFEGLRWRDAPAALEAWQRGQTGIPMVDAGMRELWETGYMHNRVRMLTASLLAKNLLIDWRKGEQWFWDCLVDADVANNPGNWQWVAGSGNDASPYFRIFNPVTQGTRFDAAGVYVRQWVPEVAGLPDKWVHQPWEAPPDVLDQAGIGLGKDYPKPVVDLATSRERALAAFAAL
jgi:deoxyribodipyrimidine photo-lyase